MTTYLWSRWRYAMGLFGPLLVMGTVLFFVMIEVMALIAGRGLVPRPAVLWWVPTQALCNAVGGTIGTLLAFRRRPPWLRFGQAGVELATQGGDATFIPWAALSSAHVSGRWLFARLVVTSNSPEQIGWRSRRSWRVREQPRNGVITFKVYLMGMRGGRPAKLAHRGPVDLRTLLPVSP